MMTMSIIMIDDIISSPYLKRNLMRQVLFQFGRKHEMPRIWIIDHFSGFMERVMILKAESKIHCGLHLQKRSFV